MSSIVAVAGGTGSLGRTIVEAIVADAQHKVFILARESKAEREPQAGAQILTVDYSNIDNLVEILNEHNIDTVISALSVPGVAESELNLIAAANQALSTRRYVPSFWGIKFPRRIVDDYPVAKAKWALVDALAQTGLEYTVWLHGYLSDYYVSPPIKTHMPILTSYIDVPNETAAIPGSGEVPVVLTNSVDLAKFVSASLTLPKWAPEMSLVGDRLTLNQLVEVLETVRGVKFKVSHDSVEEMKTGKVTELPGHVPLYAFYPKEALQGVFATIGLLAEDGTLDCKDGHDITKDFPDIKLRTINELLLEGANTKP
ncbi:hypothetical protein B0J13DRAFT_645859 [Dactylonectria estremocensis]|uniref:NmrA-like domain-containing protein n=1 Tax=Dactylonectria estremocensis TaxID=1079267 RepID=A0A9P9E0L0_9HYPO|nr:hypothetical protein B0J13DRAFT_645859 [Dactylonectria estremocensis]